MRKIVQISTSHQSGYEEEVSIFALCNDGTLWYTICGTDHVNIGALQPDSWTLVANVPQDFIEDDDELFSQNGY